MTNQPRAQAAATVPATLVPSMGVLCVPLAFVVPVAQFSVSGLPVCACGTHVAPADKEPKEKAAKADKMDAAAPAAAATRTPGGAGLPAALVSLLRGADGPFLANEVFSVPPSQPLDPIEEEVPAPKWYAITRGRFVGVVDQYALAETAISGVGGSAHKSHSTQSLALDAFNRALTWGGVQVI
ncbi:hypothetical protein B0H16DRAFT_1745866 [Mycena metata]|uniref:Ribonuclease H1 N-terminal domain-containing protein n=1 Tax=Mycena metata TaxID=1033252 RepID=A0AAD7H0Q2_9AGAR|nr:hypothetical protein B0H16DRAFT_1745866 [Mycena metata]